jgi:mRNA-degrading endonuclease RelE of RelBE toxin-antitoxin system
VSRRRRCSQIIFIVPYEIQFVASAKEQLKGFAVSDRTRIIGAIEKQLSNEPKKETRHRKRLRPNPLAPWELRVGHLRVFYDVEDKCKVTILAVGTKDRNKLYIGGKEIQL